MLDFTEKILNSTLASHVFRDRDLAILLAGTPASRYGLLNKAMKKNEITRLRRGMYVIAHKYAPMTFSKFYLANCMELRSYVTAESALAYHGFIPEKVVTVTSIVPYGRQRQFVNPYGRFEYHVVPINTYEFFTGIERHEINKQAFFIASPLRALADLVYLNKYTWQGIDFLLESLRIEEKDLNSLSPKDFDRIINVYRNKRVLTFLNALQETLKNE